MFGLGMPELVIILVIVIVLFGASKLPQIGKGMGEAIGNFKKSVSESRKADMPSEEAVSDERIKSAKERV